MRACLPSFLPCLLLSASSFVCGSGCDNSGSTGSVWAEVEVPSTYTFDSRFEPGASSVSHPGQTMRHLLIADLKKLILSLTADLDEGRVVITGAPDVVDILDTLFAYESAESGDAAPRLSPAVPLLQGRYRDVSESANLRQKLAGNDAEPHYPRFIGWSDRTLDPSAQGSPSAGFTPTWLVRAIFARIADHAQRRALLAETRPGPDGQPLPVHLTDTGLDLAQLTEKFLLGAVALHQAADDYLDDDLPGKGILADAATARGPYTQLERHWDEAFGYFGASANYGDLTAADLATGPRERDADGDGKIDLFREYNFGAAVNAAKRDHGSAAGAKTGFMGAAWRGFLRGRALCASLDAAPSPAQLDALRASRDEAMDAWEAAYAATAVHYINEVLADMARFSTEAYRFADHAKHWSELKGFALSFQFNPRSAMPAKDFERLHTLLGDRPVLQTAAAGEVDSYRDALRDARALLASVYAFDAANLGDANGSGGW